MLPGGTSDTCPLGLGPRPLELGPPTCTSAIRLLPSILSAQQLEVPAWLSTMSDPPHLSALPNLLVPVTRFYLLPAFIFI